MPGAPVAPPYPQPAAAPAAAFGPPQAPPMGAFAAPQQLGYYAPPMAQAAPGIQPPQAPMDPSSAAATAANARFAMPGASGSPSAQLANVQTPLGAALVQMTASVQRGGFLNKEGKLVDQAARLFSQTLAGTEQFAPLLQNQKLAANTTLSTSRQRSGELGAESVTIGSLGRVVASIDGAHAQVPDGGGL